MIQSIRSFAILLVVLAGLFSPQVAAAQSAPTDYWGAYVDASQLDNTIIDRFEAAVGKRESIVHWGWSWYLNNVEQPFRTQEFENIRLRGSIPMINWDSWELGTGVDNHGFGPSTITLADVYNGRYDAFVTRWAQDAKAWGHPFFLRFDHEMNGWWYPWSEQANGNHPGDYVRAWRHVHDIFTSVGATNVTWVWCINVEDVRTTPPGELYPGDSYVNWLAYDSYNNSYTNSLSWLTPNQVFGYNPWGLHNTYQDLVNLAPSKPIMIAETATTDVGGDPGAWIRDAYGTQLQNVFPRVKAVVWFSGYPGDQHAITDTPSKQAAFASAIASPFYSTNTFRDLPPGPIQPLSGASATTSTVTLMDVGDSYTDASQPYSTAGGASLTLASGAGRVAFLRFDMSSLGGRAVQSAMLRVHTSSAAGAGSTASFNLMYVPSNAWAGDTMSAANPAPISTWQIGTLIAPGAGGTWYTSALNINGVHSGLFSMAVVNASTGDGLTFNSKEGDPALTPQLIVTVVN